IYTCNYDVYRIDNVKGIATCNEYFPSVVGAELNSTGTYINSTHPDISWISIYRF
ncbi:YncE family protein, partial [Pseudomonas syringae pv. tagetis]